MGKENKTRRSILQTSGLAVAGLLGISGVSSAKTSQIRNFDPDNKEEVHNFVSKYKPLNNPEVAKGLSKEQIDAILDVYTNIEWEYETLTENVSTMNAPDTNELVLSPQGGRPANAHIEARGKTPIGTTEYTFVANFSWTACGDGNGYRNVTSNSDGWSNALAAHYVRGSRNHGKTTTYRSYFHAWESGQFTLELVMEFRQVRARIKIRGDEQGGRRILAKNAPI